MVLNMKMADPRREEPDGAFLCWGPKLDVIGFESMKWFLFHSVCVKCKGGVCAGLQVCVSGLDVPLWSNNPMCDT